MAATDGALRMFPDFLQLHFFLDLLYVAPQSFYTVLP